MVCPQIFRTLSAHLSTLPPTAPQRDKRAALPGVCRHPEVSERRGTIDP